MAEDPDPESRQSSVFEPPEYKMTYGADGTLQWEPPASSKELALALSYYFPREPDLAGKMQAATRRFLKMERRRASSSKVQISGSKDVPVKSFPDIKEPEYLEVKGRESTADGGHEVGDHRLTQLEIFPTYSANRHNHSPQTISTIANAANQTGSSPMLNFLAYDPEKGKFKGRGTKRRYEKEEREKVAKNRGHACEKHRRQKIKVCSGTVQTARVRITDQSV